MSEIPLWSEKTHDQNLSKDCGKLYGQDANPIADFAIAAL